MFIMSVYVMFTYVHGGMNTYIGVEGSAEFKVVASSLFLNLRGGPFTSQPYLELPL